MDNYSSIVLRVENNVTYIDGKLDKDIYKELKKELGYLPEDSYWMIESHKNKYSNKRGEEWRKEWDGRITTVCWNQASCKCHIKKSGTHFPTGLFRKAEQLFKENGISYSVKDIRKKSQKTHNFSMSEKFEVRDYQEEIVQKALKVDRGIIKASTGSGKTPIASRIIAERGIVPAIFYVPSIDLLIQAKNELEKFIRYQGMPLKIGMIGGGSKQIEDITVMTIQTAVRALGGVWTKFDDEDKDDKTDIEDIKEEIVSLIRNAKLTIGDECQCWAAETCQIISDNSISAQYKWGASATPYRDKNDDILLEGCVGKVVADINASFLIKKGFLVKPTIFFIPVKNKNKIGVNSYSNVYKTYIVENEVRNNCIAEMAIGYAEKGRNVLILCKQISHGKILEKMILNSTFLHGSCSGKKRKEHLDKMRRGEARLTIASVIFDEGINVRPLDTLILAGSGKSSTRALQRIGRILRPYTGKEGAIVVDFMDRCKYLQGHSKKRLQIYRTEPEFEIIELSAIQGV